MTVVEKIHQLSDELLRLRFVTKLTKREESRMAQLREQLQAIRTSCPDSWAAAKER